MDDFSLNDAALADKVLSGVPPEQTDDELARRGFPSAFDDLLQQYRMIQQKVQQGGAPAPQTTVADDIKGLIALNNQLSPQVGQVIQQLGAQQGQGQPMPAQGAPGMPPQMPPQGQPEPQPQPQPQPQPPPMQQGLGGIDAGMMQNPQLARGGIIAFADGGGSDKEQEAQEPMTYNTYMASQPQVFDTYEAANRELNKTLDPFASEQQETKLPSSYADYMKQTQSDLAGYKKEVAAREERIKNRPLYQAASDPSIEEDRRRIVAEKLSNEHDIDKDRWKSLVDMGLAWAESAAKGDDPLVSYVAGSKAGITSLRKINDDYKKTQAALDKELIALDHAKYVAEETQRKSAYDQVTAIETKIDALHDTLFAKEQEVQKNAVTAAIQHQQATTKSTANPSNYEIQMGIELAVLREQNNKLPPDQRKSEAELRQKASQNAMFNAGQQLKVQNAQDEDFTARYIKEANTVRTALSDPSDRTVSSADRSRYRQATTAQEKEQIVQDLVNARLSIVPTPGAGSSSSSSSAASPPPAPASSSSSSSAGRVIKYDAHGNRIG